MSYLVNFARLVKFYEQYLGLSLYRMEGSCVLKFHI
jgi:hypothetical protein